MKHHILRAFESDLHRVSNKIMGMGKEVQNILSSALDNIAVYSPEKAQKIIKRDHLVNRAEYEIETMVVMVIALRQPVALDLREMISAIKIANNLERMGDLAKNIAKKHFREKDLACVDRTIMTAIYGMAHVVQNQIKTVLTAYSKKSESLSIDVWRKDADINSMNKTILHQLISCMTNHTETIAICIKLLFIVKSLERIGDHVTNVAEMVRYVITGKWPEDEGMSYADTDA